jgi:hypothetical protein
LFGVSLSGGFLLALPTVWSNNLDFLIVPSAGSVTEVEWKLYFNPDNVVVLDGTNLQILVQKTY